MKFSSLQGLGRALMLPIAMLPIAGMLLRFGQPDLLNIAAISDAGNAIFANLPLLFAIGVAIGFAKDNNGTAGLAGAVGYLILIAMLKDINKDIDTGVFGGILIGIMAGLLYNRFKDIKLPEFLAFFGGKRFVPIITGILSVILGFLLGFIWPPIQSGLHTFSLWMSSSGIIGMFLYGVANKVFIIFGLHHVLNSLFWFQLGDFTNSSGVVVHGDIARFMAGDKTAGFFMAGYFPIMMFGLPAACLAMYKNALPTNKKAVGGLLLSMALTSFLTGVTEPIEYSFVFLAPVLYAFHALLTGMSLAVMYLLNVHLGFTFSAGLIDYILFFKQAQNPLYLLPVGIATFLIYYFLFDFFIRKFNLPTIGRDTVNNSQVSLVKPDSRALQFIESLGGSDNLISVDACMTRLRLIVKDSTNINKDMLKALGARGVLAPSKDSLQVILGPTADSVASEIREAMASNHQIPGINKHEHSKHSEIVTDSTNKSEASTSGTNITILATNILKALGGEKNIDSLSVVALTRLRVSIHDENLIDIKQFDSLGSIKLISFDKHAKQVYVGQDAELIYQAMHKLME
jgi:PTS system N-acetylglucosamine-specific IIC component